MFLIFLIMLAPPLIVVLIVGLVSRGLRSPIRTVMIVLSSVLLLTPSLGPATIAVVPAPFAYLLIGTVLDSNWSELIAWVMEYPLWHSFAFPATALISYVVVRWLRPNNSFKPSPHQGGA